MTRQFAPVLPQARQATQARQAFGGSRGGAVRNAAPVAGAQAASLPRGNAVGALYPSQTANTASAGDDTLTLGATPLEQSLLITVNGTLLAPADYALSGAVVTLDSALSASDVIVDQYWTETSSPAASVLS